MRPNPPAISPHDHYEVYNTATDIVLETHFTLASAKHAVEVVNEHEQRYDRPQVYAWREKP
jgi:hypothetical protein